MLVRPWGAKDPCPDKTKVCEADTGPEPTFAGAPTSADLAKAVDAFQAQGVEVAVSLENNYVVIFATYISQRSNPVAVVNGVTRVAWQAVPGDYEGVCVQSSTFARQCKEASALRGQYGEPGGNS